MSFNGSGLFQINSSGQPVVANTLIAAAVFNAFTADIATGLSNCITKDGQTTVTGNIPFGGFKLTGVGAATALTDAPTAAQVQNSAFHHLTSPAGTNTITATATPTPSAYAVGQQFEFVPAATNTGATTLNVSSLGAKNVFINGGACVGGEIKLAVPALVVYDGTQFNLVAPGSPAVLGANTFTGAQILSDQRVSRAMFLDCGYTYLDKGNSGTSTQTLDYTAGSHQRVKATGNFTIATSNWPPTGNLGEILLELVGDGTGRTITWPTINWVKSDGTLTTTFASNGVTLITTDNAPNFCVLWTRDAGTTLYGKFIR